MAGIPCRVQFDVQHPFGNDAAFTGSGHTRILDGVLQVEEHTRTGACIAFVHQNGAAAEQVAVPFNRQVDGRVKKRMPRADECGKRLSLWRERASLSNAIRSYFGSTGSPTPISRSRFRTGAGTWVTSYRRASRCLTEPPSRLNASRKNDSI